ncbi:serine carboxypeptidase-like 2 [Wolffia australiana]
MRAALLVTLVLVLAWPSRLRSVYGGKIVKTLPGFDGPLPFELETGYISVDDQDVVNLFYYFIKSERNPADDPVLYWIDGGPGCSALNGLAIELGPLRFDSENYNGEGLPRLLYWEESWTKVSSIVFVDWPAGTGFSYTKANPEDQWSDTKALEYLHVFIRKWFLEHPEFLSNPFYVSGESYGGKMLPIVTQEIMNGQETGAQPVLNLKGFLVGNPITFDKKYDEGTKVEFSHGMGLISDELYEDTKRSCGGEFVFPRNLRCKKCLDAMEKNLAGLHPDFILDKECGIDSPNPKRPAATDRFLISLKTDSLFLHQLRQKRCREYAYLLSKSWADNPIVQEALGVSKEWAGPWIRCNRYMKSVYSFDIPSAVPYYFNISLKGLRGLVYSGDHDLRANFFGTQAWIRSFHFPIVDDWRSWRVDGQVAGYTRTYAPGLTFATVKGAGHMAFVYKPQECRVMFERWISGLEL